MFKTEVDGRTAFVQYRLLGDSLDIIHTIVHRPIEGRGIAAALVKAAYAYAIANGMKPKECTMDEMIELNLNYIDEFNKDSEVKYTVEEARKTMKEFFPQLKRWK